MTLNATVRRIREIVLSHGQIKSWGSGALLTDFLNDKKTKYAAAYLLSRGGTISISGQLTTLGFTLFFLDLVHVSQDTKENELDAQSDMVNIAADIITKMNSGSYPDWRVSKENTIQLLAEGENDMVAGCSLDFSIQIMFKQNICEIPS